jgi:hypothetical protein
VACLWSLQQLRLLREVLRTANPVDRTVARGAEQPPTRVFRNAILWPSLRRDRKCFLSSFLGEVEVAEEAD